MKEVSTFAEILVYQVDMLEEEQVECMVQAAVNEWGRVDYAVNAAGKKLLSFSTLVALADEKKKREI